MTTTLTPPDATPAPAGPPPVRTSSRAVAIVAIVLGAVVVLGTFTGMLLPALLGGTARTEMLTASSAGLDRLDVDASGGSVQIRFGDVTDAELTVTSAAGADGWSLCRNGDALTVTSGNGWRGLPFGRFWGPGREAVLTLPRALDGMLDTDLSLAGGGLDVDGGFRALSLDVSGGSADVRGGADTLSLRLQAGSADVRLSDVRTADLSVEAGSADIRLSDQAPTSVTLTVAAGSASVALPDATYAVTRSVSAGNLDNRLQTSPTASRTVSVDVSGGSADLRPLR